MHWCFETSYRQWIELSTSKTLLIIIKKIKKNTLNIWIDPSMFIFIFRIRIRKTSLILEWKLLPLKVKEYAKKYDSINNNNYSNNNNNDTNYIWARITNTKQKMYILLEYIHTYRVINNASVKNIWVMEFMGSSSGGDSSCCHSYDRSKEQSQVTWYKEQQIQGMGGWMSQTQDFHEGWGPFLT